MAEHLGLPFVSIAHLPLNREARIPPPFAPWAYNLARWAEARNRVGYAIADLVVAPIHAVLNAQRSEWKMTPIRVPDDSFSRLAEICTMPKDFDFPRLHLPECFHYVGPFLDRARPPEAFPWERLDGRPLIYASFGTVLNQGRERFEAVASACAEMRVQLVLSTGGSTVLLDGLPGSHIVVTRAPQLELLERAQLAITHAGLNTVLEAMRFGIPMVAVPITNDQPAVAARIQHAGLGETIPASRLSARRLREALELVLGDSEYRRRAKLFQQLIVEAGGSQRAAQIAEEVLRHGGPVKVAKASSSTT